MGSGHGTQPVASTLGTGIWIRGTQWHSKNLETQEAAEPQKGVTACHSSGTEVPRSGPPGSVMACVTPHSFPTSTHFSEWQHVPVCSVLLPHYGHDSWAGPAPPPLPTMCNSCLELAEGRRATSLHLLSHPSCGRSQILVRHPGRMKLHGPPKSEQGGEEFIKQQNNSQWRETQRG